MIPKIIHYCWFGGNPLPPKVKEQVIDWQKKMPDYKFKMWDETNFDINSNDFTKQMYKEKKWAFVSDYVRLYALVNYGGFYLDTDVKVLKNFDSLLNYTAICGFESMDLLSTAFLAAEPKTELFSEWLSMYQSGLCTSEEPNTILFTKISVKHGLKLNNSRQKVDNLEVFPTEYFSPKDYKTGLINLTEESYTVHLFGESWKTPQEKIIHAREAKLIRKYGAKQGHQIAQIINLLLRMKNVIIKRGIKGEIIYLINKHR